MPIQIDDNTEFNYLVPTSPMDGNIIGINNQNGSANVVFYQIRKQTGQHIDKVDVISSISIANIDDLRNFRDAVSEAIDQFEKQEK